MARPSHLPSLAQGETNSKRDVAVVIFFFNRHERDIEQGMLTATSKKQTQKGSHYPPVQSTELA